MNVFTRRMTRTTVLRSTITASKRQLTTSSPRRLQIESDSTSRATPELKSEADSSAASYGNHPESADKHADSVAHHEGDEDVHVPALKKTQAQLDEEMRQKMAGISGDGGESGVEMEGGKEKGMGRAVRDNMFRYI